MHEDSKKKFHSFLQIYHFILDFVKILEENCCNNPVIYKIKYTKLFPSKHFNIHACMMVAGLRAFLSSHKLNQSKGKSVCTIRICKSMKHVGNKPEPVILLGLPIGLSFFIHAVDSHTITIPYHIPYHTIYHIPYHIFLKFYYISGNEFHSS